MPSTLQFPLGRWSFSVLTLALAGYSAPAELARTSEFSAEIVSRGATGAVIGTGARLYVANRQVRIETPEAPDGYFLVDGTAGTAIFVRPAARVFMDAKQSTRLTRIFVPVDPADPCRQWQAAAQNAGESRTLGDWHCERIGNASTSDGMTIEYQVVFPDPESSRRWIDRDLEFPVKLRVADGSSVALEKIRVEAQPATLFSVPPGYRRFDPQGLIDRIKHSDVWVPSVTPDAR